MILLKISEIQKAMAHLLIRDAFDECYLEQVEVLTFAKLTMQGGRIRIGTMKRLQMTGFDGKSANQ